MKLKPSPRTFIIYSAVIADYDFVQPPAEQKTADKFVLFTDTNICAKGWESVPLQRIFDTKVASNRYHKFFPHLLFPDSEYSLYIDGNIGIVGDLSPIFEEFVESGSAIGVFRHRDRDVLQEEFDTCLRQNKFDASDLSRYRDQMRFYRQVGMPADERLTDNAVIFRWHRHPSLAPVMQEWWQQLELYTKRDQLSLPYVVWKNGLQIKVWDWSFRTHNRFLVKYPHSGGPITNMRTKIRHYLRLKGMGATNLSFFASRRNCTRAL